MDYSKNQAPNIQPSAKNVISILEIIIKDAIHTGKATPPEQLKKLIATTAKKVYGACIYHDKLLSEHNVAEKYELLTVVKLRNMRSRKQGPAIYKTGPHRNSRVYYKVADIETWLNSHYQTFAN